MRGQKPYRSENLPYPSVHLVIEKDKSGIFGVTSGKFSRLLEGQGFAFAIKFRPGGFYPFVDLPVSRYTDKTTHLIDVFGEAGNFLETAVPAAMGTAGLRLAEAFLRSRHPDGTSGWRWINEIIEHIAADRNDQVDDLKNQFNLTKRTLERLFAARRR
jgi:hypothetical protein